jgi:sugar/nucleoside kinase (ribokinase family)
VMRLYTTGDARYRMPAMPVRPHDLPVTVIGGMNMDIHVAADTGTFDRSTSNPATVRLVPGGVGRNIAENLARLGMDVRLLGAVGGDPMSDQLLAGTAAAGVDVCMVARIPGRSCGIYVALLNGNGELDTGASDMTVVDEVNIAGVPVVMAPVSVAKAERIVHLNGEIFLVTPNAGDAFVSGLVAALHARLTMSEAMNVASETAAIVLDCIGPRWGPNTVPGF